jgi:RsiW-degrading membrane proteinase PrsW (M82 family)
MSKLAVTVAGETRLFDPAQTITIGSSPDSTIVFTDPSVSPLHACIVFDGTGWVVHDRSTYGTFVDGVRVTTIGLTAPASIVAGASSGSCIGVAQAAPAAFGAPLVDLNTVKSTASSLVKAAPLIGVVLPLKSWWAAKEWRRGYPIVFLAFGLVPWMIMHAVNFGNDNITTIAWGFSIYFAAMWAVFMWVLVRPGSIPIELLAKVAIGGAAVGMPLAIALERNFGPASNLTAYIFGVGLPEEFAKALPVFVFMYLARKQFSTRMYLYMGAVSGLAFGAFEAVNYTKLAASGPSLATTFMTMVVWRLLTDGLFHACTAGISCYFIGLAATHTKYRVQLIAFGLAFVAVLHGVSDRYASSWLQVGLAALLLFTFVGYVMNGDAIEQELTELVPMMEASGYTGGQGVERPSTSVA